MGLNLVQTVAPASAAVSRTEAKLWCKVDSDLTEADTLFDELVEAATRWVQDTLSRQLVTATWRLTLDRFPRAGECWIGGQFHRRADEYREAWLRPPRAPLLTVTSIAYVDTDGASQTLAADQYRVLTDHDPGRIEAAYGVVWPATRHQSAAVTITFTAGYGVASAVPAGLKVLVKMLVAHWWRNPEAVLTGTSSKEIDLAVQALLVQHSTGEIA